MLGQNCEITAVFERAREGGRSAAFYNRKPKYFTQVICNSLPLGGINNWTREPASILKKGDFDIVVLNGWRTFSEQNVISYCKNHKIPYIFYINGGIVPAKEAKWIYKYKRRNITGANLYFCPEERSKEYLIHYGADPKRILFYPYSTIFEHEVIKHSYDAARRIRERKKAGYHHEKLFISSGQFIPRKNFEQLIRLWSKLPKEYGLIITGEGPLKEKYEALIQELGLGHRIRLLPYQNHADLLMMFRYCDGFVFSSKEDIYGHVINEAMSQGLPVISSNKVNAALNLIQNGVNGYVIDVEDEEAYLKAVQNIQEDMREEARKVALQNTIEKSAEFHLDIFEKFLGAEQ